MSAKRFFIFVAFFTSTLYSPLSTPISYAFTVTDDAGHTIEIASPPKRIISLAPGLTEILFFLGLGDRIVGVSDYCDYPQDALTKPKVGGLHVNVETMLTLRPDLVVGTAGLYQEENIAQFNRFHIPFLAVDPSSLDKIFKIIHVLGTIAGVEEAADEKIRRLRERSDSIRREVATYPHPRLLYVVSKEPLISVGKGSYLDDLIRGAGGINITGGMPKAYPVVSMEYVIRQDPQVIILATDADQVVLDDQKRDWSRWSSLSAVRDGRIYKVRRDLLNRPGPRVIDGLEELAGLLHPMLNRPGP